MVSPQALLAPGEQCPGLCTQWPHICDLGDLLLQGASLLSPSQAMEKPRKCFWSWPWIVLHWTLGTSPPFGYGIWELKGTQYPALSQQDAEDKLFSEEACEELCIRNG